MPTVLIDGGHYLFLRGDFLITGQEFREIRELKELSLRDLAKFCDVSPQFIGQIEQGKKHFTKSNYKQIIDAMNLATVAKARGELEKKKSGRPKGSSK